MHWTGLMGYIDQKSPCWGWLIDLEEVFIDNLSTKAVLGLGLVRLQGY